MAKRTPKYEAFPPGDLIRRELEHRGWTQGDLARIMGRPLQIVNQIINGSKKKYDNNARGLTHYSENRFRTLRCVLHYGSMIILIVRMHSMIARAWRTSGERSITSKMLVRLRRAAVGYWGGLVIAPVELWKVRNQHGKED